MPPAGAPLASSRDFAPPPAPLASAEKSAPPPAAEREAVAAGAAPAEEAKSATAPRSAPVAANETTPPRGVPMQDTGVEPVARMEKASLAAAEPEAADEFAGQPTYTTLHGRNARRLTALAERMQVAPAWDSAAAEWAALLLGTAGGRSRPRRASRWPARATWPGGPRPPGGARRAPARPASASWRRRRRSAARQRGGLERGGGGVAQPEGWISPISCSFRYSVRSLMPRICAAFWRCPLHSLSTRRM